MLIRTQDKMCIINAVKIYCVNELGNKKYYLCAKHDGFVIPNETTLGTYCSKEKIVEELDLICSFFSLNPNGIYQMT